MKQRKCTNCGRTKNEDLFCKRGDKYRNECLVCHRKYCKSHYSRNRKYYTDKTVRLRKRNQQLMIEYLSDKECADCGESNIVVLDFDHERDKKYNVSLMVNSTYGWSTILEEIAKCDIVCANHHRIRTAKRFGYYRMDKLVKSPASEAGVV